MATSPTSGPGGSGFDASTGRAFYGGNVITIGNGAQAYLTWDSLAAGTELLNRAVPSHPVVLVAGVYAVSVITSPNGLTAGGAFELDLAFAVGTADEFEVGTATAPMPAGTAWIPSLSLTACCYLQAGWVIGVFVTNLDGVSARNFFLGNTIVQRIA